MESSCQSTKHTEQSFLLDSSRKRTESSSNPVLRPSRNTEFGFSIAKPISLLVLNVQENQFHLSQAAKNYLESLKGECYVISVSGNPLVGKSSLLNLLLSLFNKDASQENISYQDMYPIGDGKRSTTEGIDMYCLSVSDKNFIFLDVEGDNDPNRKETGVWIYTNLIQTAVGVSHVHLYNYNGLPQETFLSYFESISKIVKQNNIHADFETKYAFFKRNYFLASKDILAEELEDFKSYFDERLIRGDLDYSLYLLPTPPLHIIERKSKTSCIALTGILCADCQSHLFTSILLDLYHELNDHISHMTPFNNGSHVAKAFEQLIEINKKELPFFLDGGHISKIRLNSFKKEQTRIQANLLEVERFQAERSLSKKIQKLLNDHPNLGDVKLGENFNNTQISLATEISQMGCIIPELSKFIEQYLLDDKASILNEKEKEALWETYVVQFDKLTNQVRKSLKKYDEIIESLVKNLLNIKTNIQANLQEYMVAASGAFKKSIAVVLEVGASGIVGFLGKEAVTKAVAVAFVGGGAVGAVLTAYFFMQAYDKLDEAKKKHEEALNKKKIDGINNVKEAEEAMKIIEDFVTKLVSDLENNRKILKKICLEEEKSGKFNLIEKISQAMNEKISGNNLSDNSRVQLIEGMKFAEKNLQRLKGCL